MLLVVTPYATIPLPFVSVALNVMLHVVLSVVAVAAVTTGIVLSIQN